MSQSLLPRMRLIEFASIISMSLTAVHLLGYEQVTWFHCFLPILICWAIGAIIIAGAIVVLLLSKIFSSI